MKPEPSIPIVLRSFVASGRVTNLPDFIDGPASGLQIVVIERGAVKALPQHEKFCDSIPATAWPRCVVTTGTGIGVRGRKTIEVSGKCERRN